MERLTAREESGNAYYPHCFREDTCGGGGCAEHSGICEFSEKVCETLAAYEDTNLTQEQIVELDRAYREKCEEVAKLEKENKQLKNRCRVLGNGMLCFYCPIECENRTFEFRGEV